MEDYDGRCEEGVQFSSLKKKKGVKFNMDGGVHEKYGHGEV